MIRRSMILAAVLAAAAWAQTKFDNRLTVMFANGGALSIHTESTLANSPVSTSGVVAIAEGDVSHRMVIDRRGKVLFAYDLLLSRVPNDRKSYSLQLRPADPNYFVAQYVTFAPGDQLRIDVTLGSESNGTYTVRPDGHITIPQVGDVKAAGLSQGGLAAEVKKRWTGQPIADASVSVAVLAARRDYPTIAAARDLVLHIGEGVNLDILFNPSTGEKVFDVIQPVEPPANKSPRIAPEDEISLERIRISVNGTVLKEFPNNWMIGGAAKISLPRHGTVYLAVKPSTNFPFQPVGRVDGGKLTFPIGNDMVEIVSRSNVLKTSETGTVWVYVDATPKRTPGATAEVGMLDDLLPKRE